MKSLLTILSVLMLSVLILTNCTSATTAQKYQTVVGDDFQTEEYNRKGNEYFNKEEYKDAKYWYEKAAEKGDAQAMNNLGGMYYMGKGLSQDYSQAIYWYKKAADKGNASAMYNLGVLSSEGTCQDYKQVKYWYEKAAEKGNISAINSLAIIYQNKKKYSMAIKYYQMACDKGNEDACYLAEYLKSK